MQTPFGSRPGTANSAMGCYRIDETGRPSLNDGLFVDDGQFVDGSIITESADELVGQVQEAWQYATEVASRPVTALNEPVIEAPLPKRLAQLAAELEADVEAAAASGREASTVGRPMSASVITHRIPLMHHNPTVKPVKTVPTAAATLKPAGPIKTPQAMRALLAEQLVQKGPRPGPRTAPHPPAWCLLRLRPLLCTPERRLSSLEACRGSSRPPPAGPTSRMLPVQTIRRSGARG
jgi:hypothetical protein